MRLCITQHTHSYALYMPRHIVVVPIYAYACVCVFVLLVRPCHTHTRTHDKNIFYNNFFVCKHFHIFSAAIVNCKCSMLEQRKHFVCTRARVCCPSTTAAVAVAAAAPSTNILELSRPDSSFAFCNLCPARAHSIGCCE